VVGTYFDAPAACLEYDPLAPAVAACVAKIIRAALPELLIEHMGSTSIPGCAGKGIVDLMVLYQPGRLEAARAAVDGLGFQRQKSRDPFPEERPMRTGSLEYEGRIFRLQLHIILSDSPEVQDLRRFRERLRCDPSLVAAYVARKTEILSSGITDSLDYCNAKGDFCRRVIRNP